jgi:hypothetical protein
MELVNLYFQISNIDTLFQIITIISDWSRTEYIHITQMGWQKQ